MQVEDISIDIVRKNIKNLYLKVRANDGKVCISAPINLEEKDIRQFALTKLNWIRQKQSKFEQQLSIPTPEYLSGENHYYQGDRFTLNIISHAKPSKVIINDCYLNLYIRHGSIKEQREKVLINWYRQQLKTKLPSLIAKWEKIVGVKVNDWGVKKMKTRWGTCNTKAKRIWLNLELIKYPPMCLEYVIVHELVHLLERNHGDRFQSYMSQFMPQWKTYEQELNHFSSQFYR